MSLDGTVSAFPLLIRATSLANAGRLEDAAQQVIAHLRQRPDEPQGLAKLGEIAMLLGALGQSEHFLRRALAAGARDVAVRRHLASVLNQQERLDEAAMLFAALEREIDDPVIPAMHALILDKLGHNAAAQAIQQRLAEQHGDKPHHWIAYGHSLRAAGKVDAAIAAYRHAIAADDECGEAWWALANIKSRVLTDADVAHMQRMIGIAIDVRNSAPLHFALARALHDRGRYREAFDHYEQGNQQRADDIAYDARELTAEVAEIEAAVDPAFIAALGDQPVGDAVPIFIVSLPRSGSTLLEQMLGSHPAIEPVGELPYAPAILRGAMEMATRRGKVTVPQLIARIPDAAAAAMGQDYLRRAALHRKTDRGFFVDKLPHNWSNILFIRRILPQAKFLDIRRDAMDCCFSNFSQSFSHAHASSFRLADIGQCYADYVRMMAHLDRVAPTLVHHIDYDAMVADPESQLRPALAHLGLDWDPALLDFHKLDRVVRTPSSEQVRRPLNRDGMDVWKPYADWLGPLRDTLGPLGR
ncbi:tetratricopeptide repeat-containing sulfotransferase family protein [Sphingopyxis sp.]|jgi:tetratricopeptide (TPR) repeat protein|uniref:tetratricopeptide repeat-containing sulfotransferase family protein n=1 Tax=Sphingopyxis sp. TaxID=1908224 RepID=UPI003F715E24